MRGVPLSNEQQILRIWDAFADAGFTYVSESGDRRNLEDGRAKRNERLPIRRKLLREFLDGESDVTTFKGEMASEVAGHRLWGFSGFSGQMFFNMLVSSADPDDDTDFTRLLREVLTAPDGNEAAATKIRELEDYVEQRRTRVEDPNSAPSAGFIPYFVSYFWQLQEPDTYPIYYKSIRRVFSDLAIWEPSGDLAEDYVAFWELNEEIREAIESHAGDDVHLWTIERLCLFWLNRDEIDGIGTGEEHERPPGGETTGPTQFTCVRAHLDPSILGANAEDGVLVIRWYAGETPDAPPEFSFHYSDASGLDCGWRHEPNPHVEGWARYQERTSAVEDYAYESISFSSDHPVRILWEVFDRLQEPVETR